MAKEARYSTQGAFGLKKCHDSDSAIVDILFVHGLKGNSETTWTDKDTKIFWPAALLKNDIPDSRILTLGYDADIVHFFSMSSQNRIGNHAQNLLNVLAQLRERSETNERPVIFVAHSLGGLVVEDALLSSKNSAEPHLRQIIECTLGIAFLGTPHCGSDLAHWATVFGNVTNMVKKTNTSLLETLKPESEVLARIQNDFHTMLRSRRDNGKAQLKIICFYEELPVRNIGEVVPMHSAILPAYNSIGIRKNHMDMTKFSSEEDPAYLTVSTELWRWVKEIKTQRQVAKKPEVPDVETSNEHSTHPQLSQPATINPPQQSLLSNWQPGMTLYGFPTGTSDSQMMQAYSQPWQGGGGAVVQGGNTISGQTISDSGKAVQGNSIKANKDLTFNM